MKSILELPFSNMSSLESRKAREMENDLLGENSSDIAEAFKAITSMVVE